MPRLSQWLAFALLPATAAAASCSGVKLGHTLDAASAERQISGSLSSSTGLPAPPVNCPKGVNVKAGQTFDCTTVLEGQPLTVRATLTDNKGRFTFAPRSAVLIVAKAASAIQVDVDQQTGGQATVDCGRLTVLVKAPGQTFPCTAVAAAVSRTVTVTVSDMQGNVKFQLAPPSTGSPATTGPPTTAPRGGTVPGD